MSLSIRKIQVCFFATVVAFPMWGGVPGSSVVRIGKGRNLMQAESARLDPGRAEIVRQDSFAGKKGVSLKEGVASNVGKPDTPADLVFTVWADSPGRYVFRTHAATDAKGAEKMGRTRSKHDSLRLMIAVGDQRPSKRVVFVPWSRPESCRQTLGKFALSGKEEQIRIWLPEGVRLDTLEVLPYHPPRVPEAAAAYQPTIVPPASRPRLWVNADSLLRVRANLTKGENAPLWKKVQSLAAQPFEFHVEGDLEAAYNPALERAAVAKAFVHLMTGDEASGREAVELIRAYLERVEFGNLLDITREIGRAIYSSALVYDWCYGLMSAADKASIHRNLLRLADDMEIGWPPFKQMMVNGHGDEAQVNRDLLSMAIAVYDEDPVPYRYCSYRILEELVPMRRFEYQSPRHNQGVSYGPYRFGWDMHAAWLFYRMSGKRVFDDNIMGVYKFWIYMRLPNGETLRDGDGFADGRPAHFSATALLCGAYANDPVIKGDFMRQGGLPYDPILVLLLNDPDLPAAKGFDSLPQTLDFGPVLGSMVARTGWNMGANQSDVVVEMKGGGYQFGNHQHSDAGSFQIYYRGLQAADLGQYLFYGTPYDSNFCKRSISHNMMLVVDPNETFQHNTSNDGGTRFVRACPRTPEQARTDPEFANGKVVSAAFGPSSMRPYYSVFSVDLTSSYSRKIKKFVRTFCFLNLDNEDRPAALIMVDYVTSAKAEFKKYWQVNTLQPPERTADGVILTQHDLGLTGKVDVHMLRPRPGERRIRILSGKEANSVFGQYFTPPKPNRPEANGHRIMVSPLREQATDVFLTVFCMRDEQAPKLAVDVKEAPDVYVVTLADRVVVMNRTGTLTRQPLQIDIPGDGDRQLVLAGLSPGRWGVRDTAGKIAFNTVVEEGRNTAFFVLPPGRYEVRPAAIDGAPEFQVAPDVMPKPGRALRGRVFVDGKVLPTPSLRGDADCLLLPVADLLAASAAPEGKDAAAASRRAEEHGDRLRLTIGERVAVFRSGEKTFQLDGLTFAMPAAALRRDGRWYVPEDILAPLFGYGAGPDAKSGCTELTRMNIPHREDILWIRAKGAPSDYAALYAMLTDIPGRREYWAVRGKDTGFDLFLTRPVRLAGVGITWHQGSSRKARFVLETSADGTTWEKAFEGTSSGTDAGMERYTFSPRNVRQIRFRGFGNTRNDWNSIVHFRILPEDRAER